MEDGISNIACKVRQFFITLVLKAWLEFLRLIYFHSGLAHYFSHLPQAVDCDFAVIIRSQIVW